MLPFEKTFRNSDTNSLKICETLCLGDKDCQTFAFGISGRGNGTCQLSSKIIDATNSRPVGTIFDPDFDLYARKYNCFTDTHIPINPPPRPGGGNEIPPGATQRPTSSFPPPGYGERPSPPIFGPVIPSGGGVEQPPTANTGYYETRPTSEYPGTSGTGMATGTGSDGSTYHPTGETQPGTISTEEELYTTKEQPQTTHPTSTTLHYRPTSIASNVRPTAPTGTYPPQEFYYAGKDKEGPSRYPQDFDSRYPVGNNPPHQPPNFNYPYNFPILIEHNYPLPNDKDRYPEIYAQNIPSIDSNYLRPEYGGTGNYGQKPSGPEYGGHRPIDQTGYRPSAPSGYGNGYDNIRPDPAPPGYGNVRPSGNGYGIQNQLHGSSPPMVESNNGYGNQRPPSGKGSAENQPTGYGNSRPTSSTGSNAGTYQKPINNTQTSFEIPRPMLIPASTGPNPQNGYKVNEDTHDLHSNKPCYRRVLAGKRIAPHWVRRTLVCERVDDCQRECADEKRFSCEGFNYRLDPTGRGQGDCELIEIPLSQIDLYRDSNLIRHPDYDFYERDRSASPACRQYTGCTDCVLKPYGPPPTTYRPSYAGFKPYPEPAGYGGGDVDRDRYRPSIITAVDKYRPPFYSNRPMPDYDRYDSFRPAYMKPNHYGSSIDRYGSSDSEYYNPPPSPIRPDYIEKPVYKYPTHNFYDIRPDHYRPFSYEDTRRSPPRPNYIVREPPRSKPTPFIPYLIGQDDKNWGVYGGTYGGTYGTSPISTPSSTTTSSLTTKSDVYKSSTDYWGIRNEVRRQDIPTFNYYELTHHHKDGNSILHYGGGHESYGSEEGFVPTPFPTKDRINYGHQWIRRPGIEDCSIKSSEGFRLHKGAVKYSINTPTVIECERMCYMESRFKCHTYSYRYSHISRENCLLCDRPFNLLDFYADLEPDRDFDIYAMSDDPKVCGVDSHPRVDANAQCFIRAIDDNRFFKTIVRDSLTVKSVGECELECIKANKFTCRAFTYSFGSHSLNSVIDNCQLSDWPVRDMHKERHLIPDDSFDVFERASYGQGCEIQPIADEKHKKFCYLGYGSPAKLLASAIKKVLSVQAELDCKNECIRFRENTQFKCLSFSFGSQASSYNCELSDLDQSELKLGVHYAHTNDRDYWLFAWNPFDYTCRDKITTISGSRVNNDRRIDIFKEPGDDGSWKQYSVSGKACRKRTKCEQNKVTSFFSCEIEGGEIGAWDYCCKPEHPCGYSQGFDYPWCYVGDQIDQWRTCSDKYFPHKPLNTRYPSKNDIYQSPPKPGGFKHLDDVTASSWPVTYLYSEGPPNSTEISNNVIDCKNDKC